jgi:hypothetical protein
MYLYTLFLCLIGNNERNPSVISCFYLSSYKSGFWDHAMLFICVYATFAPLFVALCVSPMLPAFAFAWAIARIRDKRVCRFASQERHRGALQPGQVERQSRRAEHADISGEECLS